MSLLSYDRKEVTILRHLDKFDQLATEEQVAIGLFMCNLSSHVKGRSWLLYFSKWPDIEEGGESHLNCVSNAQARKNANDNQIGSLLKTHTVFRSPPWSPSAPCPATSLP